MSGRDEMFDSILLRRDDVTPSQWPKLSCSQAHQIALENSDLRLDANREILFQGNGQLTASSDMLFLTGGSSPEKLTILANGNVGIGISAPTEKLEVAGKIKATELEASGIVKAVAFQGDGSALTGKVSTTGDTITGSLTIQNALTVSGNVGIGTTIPTEKLEVAGKIKATELEASGIVKAATFQGDGSALTGKVSTAGDTINGSLTIQNVLTISGNVGIGTTNPTNKLHVLGAGPVTIENAGEADILFKDTNSGQQWQMGTNGTGWYVYDSDYRLVVNKGSGNVGIGTTQPRAKLELVANSTTWGGWYEAIRLGQNAHSAITHPGGNLLFGLHSNRRFYFADMAEGQYIMTIDANPAGGGNVGIGATSPAARLEISDSFRGSLKLLATSGLGHDFGYDGGGDSLFWFTHYGAESGETRFRWDNGTSARDLLIIKNTGNVGIGTANPGYKLDVAGPFRASNFNPTSDARLKTNVIQLTNVLEKLEKIRGVSFEWNELYESLARSTGQKEIGVTAQEVEAVFPELVTTWGDEGYKAVDYSRLAGVLVEAAKELKAENQALKQRIEDLERVIEKK